MQDRESKEEMKEKSDTNFQDKLFILWILKIFIKIIIYFYSN